MHPPVLAIIMPCYNEQEALPISARHILSLLDSMVADGLVDAKSYALCVNDGSRDSTWEVISDLHKKHPQIKGINLAHNRGHQNALLAGLMTAMDNCDAAVSIDADLQDDPSAIISMVKDFNDGKEIVFGVRSSRIPTLGSSVQARACSTVSRSQWVWRLYLTMLTSGL